VASIQFDCPQCFPSHNIALDGLLVDLAVVTDRLVTALCSAEEGDVRMATTGALLAATDRLTAGVVEVLSKVSHRGVIAE
jgi:hypothetical protein